MKWINGSRVNIFCNLCHKGFDESDNVREHLMTDHEEKINTFASDDGDSAKNKKCEEKMCTDLNSCWCAFRDKEFEGKKLDEWETMELEKLKSKIK